MNPRLERIQKLQDKLNRIGNALCDYPYTKRQDVMDDWIAFDETKIELEIQQAYLLLEI